MQKKTLRKTLLLAAKLVIAVVLLGWVFSQVHWSDYVRGADGREYNLIGAAPGRTGHLRVYTGMLWWRSESVRPRSDFLPLPEAAGVVRHPGFITSIRNIRVPLLVPACLGFLASLLIVAVRWRFLMQIVGVHIRVWEAVRLTFLGQFFNAIVPGMVGGDLVKAYYVAKHTPRKAAVLVSIFIDRVIGLAELALMAGVMLIGIWISGPEDPEQFRIPTVLVAVVLALVAGLLAGVLSPRLRRLLRLQKLYRRLPFARHFAAAGEAVGLYRRRIGSLVAAFGITIVAHVAWIGSLYLIGQSLSLPTPWYSYFVYIPLIYVIGAVPLTPGGVGLVEKFYVVFFSVTCSPSQVLALAMLGRLIPMFWGLPGMIVALTGPKLPKSDAMQAELGLDAAAERADAARDTADTS